MTPGDGDGSQTAPEGSDALPRRVVDRDSPPDAVSRTGGTASRLGRLVRGVLLVALGAAAAVLIQTFALTGAPSIGRPATNEPLAEASSPAPATTSPGEVVGLATLSPTGDVVTLAPPHGARDARVAVLYVDVGDRFETGSVLAEMDNRPELEAAIASARASVAAREAELERVRISVRSSIAEGRARLAIAEAAARTARRKYDRAATLIARGALSESSLDQRLSARDQADREVDLTRATLSRYETDDLDTQPDVLVARRDVAVARAEVVRAERDLENALVRAPIPGTVLERHVEPGEQPGTDGFMDIGDLDRMTAKVQLYETLVGRVTIGDAATLTSPALTTALHGTVTRIGLLVDRQSLVDSDPAARTDARVVEVTVALDAASTAAAARFTGLQVTARIRTGGAE